VSQPLSGADQKLQAQGEGLGSSQCLTVDPSGARARLALRAFDQHADIRLAWPVSSSRTP